jgi:putative tryptophan/tyrosine transport system substrate-binding protein
MRRMNKNVFNAGVLLFVLCLPADAQQAKKIARLGWLGTGSASGSVALQREAFHRGLRDLGYVEGQNIIIEYRYAEGLDERLPNLAAELVQLKVDVIVATGTSGVQAAKNATKTIPIVMANIIDPVGTGLVASLAHLVGTSQGCLISAQT